MEKFIKFAKCWMRSSSKLVIVAVAMLFMFMCPDVALAQDISSGISAMEDVNTQVWGYYPVFSTLVYIICGFWGGIGAVSIIIKYNNGDQDIKKQFVMTVASPIVVAALIYGIPKILGLN